ncbi:FecR family protein [Mucilaginibacter sp. OK098]|uniref:FecR family protein n=1 Tax=Mucilaginibacter sp. OK098 TaxID=1855297 RepID=UPI0009118282|nr:FecR domain-containing protein [Mucilaginibacter sp. OK098]SHN36274.1 FecR family protein [Mucilaginibacter sp. OK098]
MDEHHYLLIIDYLEGNISEKDTQYLLQKVQTEKEFADAFEDIAEIFSAKNNLNRHNNRAYRALSRLNKSIDEFEQEQQPATPVQVVKTGFRLKSWLAVAASLLMFIGGLIAYRAVQRGKAGDTLSNAIYTAAGQKKHFTLSDGTGVMLNASSNLRIAADFDGKNREVFLQGEGWFDVKRNTAKPFIVHTGKVATQVLGTHFNISAYGNDGSIRVSLVQGKVQVDMNNDISKRIILDPGKEFVYSKADGKILVQDFTIPEITGWKENKLVFNYDSWPDAAKKLSRWYGIKVSLNDNELLHNKLKATFNNIPLTEVMQQISIVSAISWKINNGELIISGK